MHHLNPSYHIELKGRFSNSIVIQRILSNNYLDFIDQSGETGAFERHGADEVSGVIEVAHVLGVHLEERCETRHDVTDPSVALLIFIIPLT